MSASYPIAWCNYREDFSCRPWSKVHLTSEGESQTVCGILIEADIQRAEVATDEQTFAMARCKKCFRDEDQG